ncbi:MAG: arginase [Chitinophagaceae bacterium]|nr:arginase [Sediminibacterium sp.]
MKIKLIKNRSDIGAGTRGSDMGIDALEIAAINSGNDYFNRHAYEDVETHNETIYQKNTNNFAKRIEHVVQQCERVAKAVSSNLIVGNYPIVLSGDHSSALGTISGLKSANPQGRIGVIWLDAHTDIHSPFTSPSGNIHGMPLAAALGLDNLQYQINQPDEATLLQWYKMKNIGIDGPKILPQDLIYFGIRDYEEAEEKVINDQKIKFFKVEELRFKGLENCVQEAIQLLSNCDLIYISFDVDSMDCDRISYGTGTPVPAGFNPEEVIQIIQLLQATGKVKCIELTEINPLLDNKGNKMAETAFEVLDKVSNTI